MNKSYSGCWCYTYVYDALTIRHPQPQITLYKKSDPQTGEMIDAFSLNIAAQSL